MFDTPTEPLQVVFEDKHLLALVKPAGLLSVPGRGSGKADCLSARAQQRWPGACIVHRLDQATSGLILLARGADMQRALSAAFAARRVHKHYEALVHGPAQPSNRTGWAEIDLPLLIDWPNRPRSAVNHLAGKPSITRWRPLAYDQSRDVSRLALQPLTGRSHQLRVHLQAIGHPIVGDALYGPADGAPRLMLHARGLELAHPATGQALALHSEVPF
ncbi:RluA family pseudouridine synthase [Ottowia testudinis]|uniref:RluA family pseudouridine synthase n=1 Tax=Ottowia testudinis TaxID=2816950 RepID=A0A975CIM0_9BURK|nr:RluA family pseudouridine synthase [Ottowia testudinis]QTD44083.1 RluA family pseudouridine synthase [Ottowia testudinis]